MRHKAADLNVSMPKPNTFNTWMTIMMSLTKLIELNMMSIFTLGVLNANLPVTLLGLIAVHKEDY